MKWEMKERYRQAEEGKLTRESEGKQVMGRGER
jgi:hypothetical protein